jgi:excisionase family DNA binding protein
MPHAHKADIPLKDRRAYSFAEVSGLTGFAISTLYKMMHAGRLRTLKIAGRRLVTSEALDAFLDPSCPTERRP